MDNDWCSLVDPFIGTEAVELPEAHGIAATWFYIKAQIANTHPGATLPLSPVSACPYSGGYPSGYGRYDVSSHGSPPLLWKDKRAFGVTHLHHTGTGYIGYFYNYLLAMPFLGELPVAPGLDLTQEAPHQLVDETARPGYYAGRFADIRTEVELTVGGHAAAHRYRFAGESGTGGIAVDITHSGLAPARAASRMEAAAVRIVDENRAAGSFTVHGVTWFFALMVCGGGTLDLWEGLGTGVRRIRSARALDLSAEDCAASRFGVVSTTGTGRTMELYIGLSERDEATALRHAGAAAAAGFDELARRAHAVWLEHLGRIRVDGGSEAQRSMFYTALYHALQKPVQSEESNFVWSAGPKLYADFATMWDMYKTQLPLLFTVCPEHIGPIVRSFGTLARSIGSFPPAVLFARDFDRFRNQSRALPHIVLKDAFDRSMVAGEGRSDKPPITQAEWSRIAELMTDDIVRSAGAVKPGEEPNGYSHLLDVAYAAWCTQEIAAALGRSDLVAKNAQYTGMWAEAFDSSTGMMKPGSYYEGTNIHYSFRLLHSMENRIRLAGGRARYLELLDSFFGYGAQPVSQLREPPWEEGHERGMALGRFDGTNNEVMLETPYAYHFAGRPDRTAEVVRAVMRYHYANTAGGLPGNDDSGALSAWYLWNCLGLFPVPGRGALFVGSPVFERAQLRLGGRTLTVTAVRAGKGSAEHEIYVRRALMNGRPVDGLRLRYDQFLGGGELNVHTAAAP